MTLFGVEFGLQVRSRRHEVTGPFTPDPRTGDFLGAEPRELPASWTAHPDRLGDALTAARRGNSRAPLVDAFDYPLAAQSDWK